MSFGMLYKRPFDDHYNPFVYVETYPDGSIVEEPWDKGLNHRVTFNSLDISYLKKETGQFIRDYHAIDTEFNLYITESRLIIQLKTLKSKLKFRGSLIDLGIDAAFNKYENKKVENLQIIGQIRYEWLFQIMYCQKSSWKNRDRLRFCYYDSDKTKWVVTITFENDMDVRFLANEILHMSCRYKELSQNVKNEKMIAFINKFKKDEIQPSSDTNKYSFVSFPNAKTACNGKNERPIISRY